MKMLKVIKDIEEFGIQKGFTLTELKNGCFKGVEKDDNHCIILEIGDEDAQDYIDNGYMIMLDDKNKCDKCSKCNKINEVKEFVESLIKQYTLDHNEMQQAFEDGTVQPCVKVEAETVYFNLTKVLNKILNKINE